MLETIYNVNTPVSIALLSDLHGRSPEPVLRSLRIRRPELIAIAGDVIYGHPPKNDLSPLKAQQNILPFLTGCAATAPTFFSLGNHEWMLDTEDLELIRNTGTIVLDNEWKNWNGLTIGGLTSAQVSDHRRYLNTLDPSVRGTVRYPQRESKHGLPGSRRIKENKPETDWLSDFASASGYRILLSHHPEYLNLIPPTVNLILSGHAHGGQWRLFGRGVFAPGQGWWPKLTSGVHENRLIVSRGLSNTSSIPRLFNPPEIVYIKDKKR